MTVDAEAGYRMEPGELVAAMRSAGAAGCNLEDSDHGSLRDADLTPSGSGRSARPLWMTAIRSYQCPGRRLLRSDAAVPAPAPRSRWFRALQRAKASRGGVDACTRSACGRRTRFAIHVRGPHPGERRTPAAGAVARRVGCVGVSRVSWARCCTGTRSLASGTSSPRFRSETGGFFGRGVDPVRREIEAALGRQRGGDVPAATHGPCGVRKCWTTRYGTVTTAARSATTRAIARRGRRLQRRVRQRRAHQEPEEHDGRHLDGADRPGGCEARHRGVLLELLGG